MLISRLNFLKNVPDPWEDLPELVISDPQSPDGIYVDVLKNTVLKCYAANNSMVSKEAFIRPGRYPLSRVSLPHPLGFPERIQWLVIPNTTYGLPEMCWHNTSSFNIIYPWPYPDFRMPEGVCAILQTRMIGPETYQVLHCLLKHRGTIKCSQGRRAGYLFAEQAVGLLRFENYWEDFPTIIEDSGNALHLIKKAEPELDCLIGHQSAVWIDTSKQHISATIFVKKDASQPIILRRTSVNYTETVLLSMLLRSANTLKI